LSHLGFPIVSDPLYGGGPLFLSGLKRDYQKKRKELERPLMGRLALHAEKLVVLHPNNREPVAIEAPWPKDLEVSLKYLRKFASPHRGG
jgi:23S rRNA-/tRNA-specific pseudouridylate synthase